MGRWWTAGAEDLTGELGGSDPDIVTVGAEERVGGGRLLDPDPSMALSVPPLTSCVDTDPPDRWVGESEDDAGVLVLVLFSLLAGSLRIDPSLPRGLCLVPLALLWCLVSGVIKADAP